MLDKKLFAKLEDNSGYAKTNEDSILNPFVDFHGHSETQTLADALVAESIQMRGVECFYLPRESNNLDLLFGEDLQSKFTKAWKFAAYLDSFEAYSGANSFYAKFGMSVNDEITLSINPGLFAHHTEGLKPKEGDLIYFKMDNALFEITWVEPYNPFYQVGRNAIIKITAQKFIYSGEQIKPELQKVDYIQLDEFSDLDLEPVKDLDNRRDVFTEEYAEMKQINKEAKQFVSHHQVINGKGDSMVNNPFDDFMNGD